MRMRMRHDKMRKDDRRKKGGYKKWRERETHTKRDTDTDIDRQKETVTKTDREQY